ncbi:hypothetical protein PInf_005017 [Phytophthora infestans]|nr:hypothetical protein PInf_005017 [Phytophthora infestans]
MSVAILEKLLVLREGKKHKAEARRDENIQRQHEDAVTRESRYLAEKAEARERYSHDRHEMDERAWRENEESSVCTQDLVLLIGSLIKAKAVSTFYRRITDPKERMKPTPPSKSARWPLS